MLIWLHVSFLIWFLKEATRDGPRQPCVSFAKSFLLILERSLLCNGKWHAIRKKNERTKSSVETLAARTQGNAWRGAKLLSGGLTVYRRSGCCTWATCLLPGDTRGYGRCFCSHKPDLTLHKQNWEVASYLNMSDEKFRISRCLGGGICTL